MSEHKRTLLLLGGAHHQVCAIETAHRLGYRTVLCDYLPDNPGQYAADVFHQVSTTDRERVLEIARAERIDGVLSYGSDVALPTAGYVAETLGLPTNPLSSIEALSEKGAFRATLKRLGLPCPGFVTFGSQSSVDSVSSLVKQLHFPIIVKPTDSSGSKGVTVLCTADESSLADAIRAAADFSRNGQLVTEEFVEQAFPHIIGGDIFVLDGEVVFWGLMGAIRDESLGGLVPVGEAYPCGLPARVEQRVRDVLQALVTGLDLRFGEMNVEVLIGPDETPYIIELAGRAGGNMIPLQLRDVSGIDLVEASVRCAMGDRPSSVGFDTADVAMATYMLHASESGSLVAVEYDEPLRQHIYREELFVEPGGHVEQLTNSSQNVGIVYLRFDSPQQMWELLAQAGTQVHVRVEPEG